MVKSVFTQMLYRSDNEVFILTTVGSVSSCMFVIHRNKLYNKLT